MNSLFIGQNSSGKTTNIKKHIKDVDAKVIVLDFNDEYDDFTDNEIYLDDINPLLSTLSLNDVKALNAGYLADSNCLHKKAEEVLRELKSYSPDYKDVSFEEAFESLTKERLVEESIERLQISWNNVETMYGKILNEKIPTKKYKKHTSLEHAVAKILESDRILLKSKSMHSDHLRAVAFILLSRVSKLSKDAFYVVGDELSSFFNNGNIRLFSQTIDMKKIHFVLSFNKVSNVPIKLIPSFDSYFVHKFESNSEIKDLEKSGILVAQNVKKLSWSEYVKVEIIKD